MLWKLTLTFAESAEDFCFFFNLADNDDDDTVGFEADDVLTDDLNLMKCRFNVDTSQSSYRQYTD